MTKLKSLALFIFSFSAALSVFLWTADKINTRRTPAALSGKVFQISTLSSEEIRSQLMKKLSVTPTLEGEKQIQLTGFSASICRNYQKIELTFQSEGVAVSGNPTEMTIIAECEAAQDPSQIKSINIPVGKILDEKPRNAEFHFQGMNSSFTFNNSADVWPRTWILKSMSFKSDSGNNKVVQFETTFAKKQSADLDQHPVVLEF